MADALQDQLLPRWDFSRETSTLTFSEDGVARVVCQMQVIGTSSKDSWEWSWGNPYFKGVCSQRVGEVRQFGEEKGWANLTTLFLPSEEYLGWECASIAVHLLGALAAYRCPDGDGVFTYLAILSAQFVA